MPLAISSRAVGEVLVVHCAGRIVAGAELESLHSHLKKSIQETPDIVLVLDKVEFVDSSGLGMLVRLVGNARAAGGDVKLCNPPQPMRNTLRLTNLDRILETHEVEGEAIISSYERRARRDSHLAEGITVLCVEDSADVLCYVTELLRTAGYRVLGGRNLYDAKILARATRPALAIVGSRLQPPDGASLKQWLTEIDAGIPLLILGEDFCKLEAGCAAEYLLDQVKSLKSSGGRTAAS